MSFKDEFYTGKIEWENFTTAERAWNHWVLQVLPIGCWKMLGKVQVFHSDCGKMYAKIVIIGLLLKNPESFAQMHRSRVGI